MVICGIDLGLGGAIAFLDERAKLLAVYAMPVTKNTRGKNDVDAVSLNRILALYPEIEVVCMEYVHSFGNEGRSSIFSFGRGTGKVQAVLELRGLAYEEVTPQAWKKEVLAGTKKDKAAAIGFALHRWLDAGLPRKHDGIADALCLAEFARRRLVGEMGAGEG